MTPKAYFDATEGVWYVPVAAEIWQEAEEDKLQPVEPARLELKDGQLWITRLEAS